MRNKWGLLGVGLFLVVFAAVVCGESVSHYCVRSQVEATQRQEAQKLVQNLTQNKANISATESQLKLLRSCLQRYMLDMKEFPPTEQGLKALVKKPADLSEAKAKRWDGPYTEAGELPKDPWGNDFQYEYPPKHGTTDFPDIWSMGPDGEDGTEDDIVSWSQDSDEKGSGEKSSGAKPSAPPPKPRKK